jgi:DNA polymerase-3 subunit epsilon
MDFLRRLFAADQVANAAQRWVVLDTETTGIDPDQDALLAIGAVAVDEEGIRAEDSFEVVLRHTGATDAANVALHGLGRAALSTGVPGAVALREFHEWVNGAPCVGFHADFDRRVLARAARLWDVSAVSGPWLDLAPLAAALRPEVPRKGSGALDDWLAEYGIVCPARHNAASDAFAAAELLLRLKAAAAAQGTVGFERLAALARHRRWLGAH